MVRKGEPSQIVAADRYKIPFTSFKVPFTQTRDTKMGKPTCLSVTTQFFWLF